MHRLSAVLLLFLVCLVTTGTRVHAQADDDAKPEPTAAKPSFKAKPSFGPGVYLEDIANTLRMQYFRSLTVSRHDPKVAYVASFNGYVFKTTDGGRTWDESRLIVDRRPFFGDYGEYLYFGVHRHAGGPSIHGSGSIDLVAKARRRYQVPGLSDSAGVDNERRRTRYLRMRKAVGYSGINPGGAGRSGAAENVNFGIGLPGGAPRLQNVVRKFEKPTAGLNIKQTLYLRGIVPTEVRIIVEHPTNPKIVFACTMYGLFMTYDGGLNWARTFQGVDWRGRRIFHVAVDPKNTNKVLLATGNGLYVSKDGGENYLKATQQGVGAGVIDWIYFNPHDSRYVFVGTDYGMLRSKDGGENFEWIYFTTFPAARVVRYIEIDPFDKKAGYIATHDGIFMTPNMLTAGLEDWKRVGGLALTGMEIAKVSLDPSQRGHMWALSNMKIPKPTSAGWSDTGGAFIYESIDGGETWQIIYAGNTYGSMQWYESDPVHPSRLWICWSRSLTRMRLRKKTRNAGYSAATARKLHAIQSADTLPTVGDLMIAAQMYNGSEIGRVLKYRFLSRIRALVPKLEVSYTRAQAHWPALMFDGIYGRSIPWRFREQNSLNYSDWRFMFYWDLAPLVFNLDTTLFGRIERMSYDYRSEIHNALLRLYGEYRRLRVTMLSRPPEDIRVRVFYKLRLEELESYIDFITGGYLTRYQRGDRPSPYDTPWFKRWEGTGTDFLPASQRRPRSTRGETR